MVTCVPGKSFCTALATTWAASWRMVSSASGVFEVRISSFPFSVSVRVRSTSFPLNFARTAALARPGPMDSLTKSPTRMPVGAALVLPSGRVIWMESAMGWGIPTKNGTVTPLGRQSALPGEAEVREEEPRAAVIPGDVTGEGSPVDVDPWASAPEELRGEPEVPVRIDRHPRPEAEPELAGERQREAPVRVVGQRRVVGNAELQPPRLRELHLGSEPDVPRVVVAELRGQAVGRRRRDSNLDRS